MASIPSRTASNTKANAKKTPPRIRTLFDMTLCKGFKALVVSRGQQNVTDIKEGIQGHGEINLLKSIILPNIGNIVRLTVLLHTNEQIVPFLLISAGSFRSLKLLRLSMVHTATVDDQPSCLTYNAHQEHFTVLQSLPKLTSLTIHTQGGPHPMMANPPLAQLTKLCFAGIKLLPRTLLDIFRTARSLIEGDFTLSFHKAEVVNHPFISPTPLPAVRMRHLKKLQLALHNPRRDPRLFSSLQLISLVELNILGTDYEDGEGWDMNIFIPLLGPASRTLKILRLCELPPNGAQALTTRYVQMQEPVPPYTIERLLVELRHLETLRLPTGIYLRPKTLEDISCGLLFPSTTSLNLSHDHGSTILAMVVKRNENSRMFPRFESSDFRGGIMGVEAIADLTLSVLDNREENSRTLQAQSELEENPACQKLQVKIKYPPDE